MSQLPFKRIAIVGLGLMGGSLAAAIRKKHPRTEVVGIARRKRTLDFAFKKKWIHAGFSEITREALQGVDLVVLCAPVEVNQSLLRQIETSAHKPLLVTDLGSVKKPICDEAVKWHFKKIKFVGAHPMVGSHEKGIEHAVSGLYSNGITLVTPSGKKSADAKVVSFWKSLSKQVIQMTPEKHDKTIAAVSHFPHLLAVCLMAATDDQALKVAGPGFRDMTRLAQGPSSVWYSIFRQNQTAIDTAFKPFEKALSHFKRILKNPKSSHLIPLLDKQSSRRKKL